MTARIAERAASAVRKQKPKAAAARDETPTPPLKPTAIEEIAAPMPVFALADMEVDYD